ncbi:MAG: ice-binding family protein [Kiritimatiellia bacterium]
MNTSYQLKLAAKQVKRMLSGLVLAAGVVLAQPALPAGPSPVNLLSTARFTILSGAAITTTGGGTITGDVGASPISGAAILLNAAQVNGTIYCVDNAGPAGSVMDPVMLTAAKGDLTTAYNEARDRVPVPVGPFLNPGAGNIGGLVLVPGLYKFTGQALITGADVTLNGGPDDVWIFQIATELIVEAGVNRSVILAGGAQAKNIFWQVGTSATLGTFCNFKGTILADQSITMDTSSTMEGRALAFSGQVAFNGTGGTIPTSSQVITNFMPTNGSTFAASAIKVGLSAQASSTLPVSFAVLSGPGVITGGTNLALASTGVVSVVASQAGDTFFKAAPGVTNMYTVTGPLPADPGWLAIQVTPIAGSWRLTAPAGYAGPTTGTGNLAAVSTIVGEYSVAYGALSGYVTPTNQTQFVVVGETSLFVGVYLQVSSSILPPDITATEGTYTNKVRVSWNSVSGATGYEIWKSRTNNVNTAVRMIEVPDYGATNFLYDDYDVVPLRFYYYWGMAKTATQASPMSLVDVGYAELDPAVAVGTADIIASDMVFLPVIVTNLTTAGTVSFWLGNLGPDPLSSSEVAYDFRMGSNNMAMVLLGTDQGAFSLAVGEEQLVILTAQAKLGLVVPATLGGVKQVQVTVRHASPLHDPNLANNRTTGPGSILVRDLGVNSPARTMNDYDGDGKADGAIYRVSDGAWHTVLSGYRYHQWMSVAAGQAGLMPVPGDYDGDGVTDLAVYNIVNGWWTVMFSSSGAIASAQFGGPAFTAAPCDFDGDAKTDPVIYRGSDGFWYGLSSADGYALRYAPGAWAGYTPSPGDYDGDGKADPSSAYNEHTGMWVLGTSSRGYILEFGVFGGPGWVAVSSDYDGDGMTDPAIYNSATATWQVLLSGSLDAERGGVYTWWGHVAGTPGGVSIPEDYDGDGLTDLATYNQDTGIWELFLSSLDYQELTGGFGGPEYRPVRE